MRVDVVYDFLCPWCHVAKRHLQLALDADAADGFAAPEIRWHQFMLYPHFDRGGHDFLEFFKLKYGEALRVPMWDQIRSVAAPIGINFAFEKMTRGPASIDGHRWAEAQRPGISSAMIEGIATSFFEMAKVIDMDFLVALASAYGFDGAEARAYLASDADLEAPFRETDRWRENGVVSMPHYIIQANDGSAEIIRQTSVEAFRSAFARVRRSIAT
jgi:predicted DsbA family dithiol-disulfide isomerase